MLINIRANWQNAKKGMNSVLGHARGMGSGIGKAFSSVKNALNSIADMMGIDLSAAAAVAGVKKLIDKMDEIEDNAPKLGVTFAYFQKMQFAAERSGTSFQAVTSGFSRIKKLAGEAAAGLRSGTDAFAMIGMSVGQIKALSPEQLFDEVTKRLNLMEDPTLRDAAAAALFGRNFTELNNFLKDHLSLGAELEARGGVISDEHILAASQYKDVISNIGFSLQAWAVNSGFILQLAKIAEGLDAISTNAKRMEDAGIKTGAETYDAGEGTLARWKRKAANAISYNPLAKMWGIEQGELGNKIFGRPSEAMTTGAVTEADKAARRAAMGQDAARKKEVNAAAAQEAKVKAAATKASRDAEAAKLNEAKKGIKDAEELKLKAAQAAMTGDSTGNVGSAARTSAKEAADNLRRVGGYTGGRNTQADTAAAQAKKQTDILTSVDSKLAVLENAARTGGMIFP
ncbi:MAG TPA: hypothetical protein PLE35_00815 [Lentisphaeria bacterium]|nr:hypothetical protein [Lentisphaeria bacterium]